MFWLIGILVLGFMVYGFISKQSDRRKIAECIAELEDIALELEAIIRSEDFESLETIVSRIAEIEKIVSNISGEVLAEMRFNDYYTPLMSKIESIYKELEIRRRVANR